MPSRASSIALATTLPGRREQHGVQEPGRGDVPDREQAGEADEVARKPAQANGASVRARCSDDRRPRRGSSRAPGGRRRRSGRACGRARPRSAPTSTMPLSLEAGPACMTPILVARMIASSMSWVMNSTVLPRRPPDAAAARAAWRRGCGRRARRTARPSAASAARWRARARSGCAASCRRTAPVGCLCSWPVEADELEIALRPLQRARWRGTPRMRRPNSTLPSAVSHG